MSLAKQVIVGPEDEDGPWYFSLNNRRLWVLKQCRDEGLLENNLIRVRVRQPKSGSEEERYTLENCAVEAKFIREKDPKRNENGDSSANSRQEAPGEVEETTSSSVSKLLPSASASTENKTKTKDCNVESINEHPDEDSESESEDSSDQGVTTNRFSLLM